MARDIAVEVADDGVATLTLAKRYLITSAGATFEEAFAVEHDAVFGEFLAGPIGPRAAP